MLAGVPLVLLAGVIVVAGVVMVTGWINFATSPEVTQWCQGVNSKH